MLTIAGEWVVHGDPVGPGTASIQLQTRIGSQATPRIDPLDVDGATLFVGASGKELREFLYAESEQAYQAADIALLSRHLMAAPIGLAFERRRRWLLIPRGDGCMAQVTIDRNSNVVAWSLLESSGVVLSVCCHRGETYGLLALGGQTLLGLVPVERLERTAEDDAAENGAVGIRVLRHHHDLNRDVGVGHEMLLVIRFERIVFAFRIAYSP